MTKKDIKTITRDETIILSGAGRVSMRAYYDFVNTYNSKDPDDITMCNLAKYYLTKHPGSDHDKIARALWTPRN